MVDDRDTNWVYFADTFTEERELPFAQISAALGAHGIDIGTIIGAKDIWCRDYMPIQLGVGQFVQFRYWPDYLKGKKYWTKMTRPAVCRAVPPVRDGQCVQSDIILDGGNVVRCAGKAILTEKVFKENRIPDDEQAAFCHRLAKLLRVERIITIQPEPGDILGHADGVLRFLDADTVLVNEYPDNRSSLGRYGKRLLAGLKRERLAVETMPYAPVDEKPKGADLWPATGCYINFLQVGDIVLLPKFGLRDDDRAIKAAEQLFTAVMPVDCSKLAMEGGVLNCASWNIRV